MIPIKVECPSCGQKYAFDVEPVHGRMPAPVACPVCAADGTSAANEILRQTAPAAPVPAAPAPAPISAAPAMRMPVAGATTRSPAPIPAPAPTLARAAAPPAAPAAAPEPAAPVSPLARLSQAADSVQDAEKWKWWYFVVAGICIGGYSIWQSYDQHRIKPLGELFLAVFCIAIGIWDFQHKRKKKRARG
jgi:hypothetical protein